MQSQIAIIGTAKDPGTTWDIIELLLLIKRLLHPVRIAKPITCNQYVSKYILMIVELFFVYCYASHQQEKQLVFCTLIELQNPILSIPQAKNFK